MVKTYSSNFVHNVNTIKQFNPIDLPGLLENIQLCPVLSGVSHTITTTATTTSTMITTTGVTGGGYQGVGTEGGQVGKGERGGRGWAHIPIKGKR